jgi:hypothetical protein
MQSIDFTAQDILAAIGFEAQRLAAGVAQHAAGASFPDPKVIQQVIDRMNELNQTLLKFGGVLGMRAEGGMTVTLDS